MNLLNKTKIYLAAVILASAGVFSSCDDILDLAPVDDINQEKIFTEYSLFIQYADHTYSYMPGHYGRLWSSLAASMGDETRSRAANTSTYVFNTGAWNGSTGSNSAAELSGMWENMYVGIRKTNLILENINSVQDFPSEEIKQRYLGETYFLRAYFYYELVKRWGGVPIVDKTLALGVDDIDLPRDSYEDCVDFIVSDCEMAASLLPLKHDDANNGRATQGAALSLKARMLLYAARPLHNPTGDVEKWRAAGEAAKEVIDLDIYSLESDLINMYFQTHCDEVIMNRPRGKMNFEQGHTDGSSFLVRFIVPQGYNGWMGDMVTQNLVDRFESSNGYPIYQTDDKGNPIYEADGITPVYDTRSNYNEEDPYSNRDPRLDMFVLRNDRYWYNRNTQFYQNGKDYGTTLINLTGYSIAKFWSEAHQRYQGTSTYFNYIFFRYAETLLNYAEAWNEVEGPDGEHNVRARINELRNRAGQVDVPTDISSTTEQMRYRIRNERQVELCFEEHRWYDVLQWGEGVTEFTRPICSMRISLNDDGTFSYERYEYEIPIFKDYMHLYPIPDDELYKSAVLENNPGW